MSAFAAFIPIAVKVMACSFQIFFGELRSSKKLRNFIFECSTLLEARKGQSDMLTSRQRTWALSPYRLSPQDLYQIMTLLSDPVSWKEFAPHEREVMGKIVHAAKLRHIPIPQRFEEAYEERTKPASLTRITDHSETGFSNGSNKV